MSARKVKNCISMVCAAILFLFLVTSIVLISYAVLGVFGICLMITAILTILAYFKLSDAADAEDREEALSLLIDKKFKEEDTK